MEIELTACNALPLDLNGFNPNAHLPFGLNLDPIRKSMEDFLDFLTFINLQLHTRKMRRLERIIMQANFSSLVGEFIKAHIPDYCPSLVHNKYHNGHPDLIPANTFPNDAVQHADVGIEIKSSRYMRGWQGHNPENTWLMVFVYDSNSPEDGDPVRPFRFTMVVGAALAKEDWTFSGRSAQSRRTITASVNRSGYDKMMTNWVYREPRLNQKETTV